MLHKKNGCLLILITETGFRVLTNNSNSTLFIIRYILIVQMLVLICIYLLQMYSSVCIYICDVGMGIKIT